MSPAEIAANMGPRGTPGVKALLALSRDETWVFEGDMCMLGGHVLIREGEITNLGRAVAAELEAENA